MKLDELLVFKNRNELDNIARNIGIRGYASLNKDAKTNLLAKSLINNDVLNHALKLLIPSGRYLLSVIINAGGTLEYYELKEGFSEQYKASSTFYNAYGEVMDFGLLYEFEQDDDTSLCLVPDDILGKLRSILQDNYPDLEVLEPEDEEIEEDNDTDLDSFADLLDDFAQKTDIQILLEEANIAKSGNKLDLIDRLLTKTTYTPTQLLDILFTKGILRDVCLDLDIPSSGTKPQLIERILNQYDMKIDEDFAPGSSVRGKAVENTDEIPVVVGRYAKQKSNNIQKSSLSDFIEDSLNLEQVPLSLDEIVDLLDSMTIMKRNLKDEDDLERQVYGRLQYWGEVNNIKVIDQYIEKKKDKLMKPDIAIGENDIMVELKYVHGQSSIADAFRQVLNYSNLAKTGAIIYFYDPQGRISQMDIDSLQSSPKVRVIVKNKDDIED